MTPEELRQPTIDALRQMRAFLSDEKRWCQGTSAKNALGVRCIPCSPEAYSFCLGCLAGRLPPQLCDAVMAELIVTVGGEWLPDFNDAAERTHADVVRALDETIARMEKPCPGPTTVPEDSTQSA